MITQTAAKTSAHFNRIHLFLTMKAMRKINPQCPQLQNRPSKNRLNTIIQTETELQISPHDEHDATQGGHTSLINNLAPGLFNAVAKCADRIVSLAPQLVSNQTSNLAESYMSIRCMMDGGKQFNRVQSGSFQHPCTAAGLATQHGPNWTTSFWKAATKQNPGPVLSAYTSAKVPKLEQDRKRKQTVAYKQQRRSTRNKNSTDTTDHHYGPESQQDDITPSELLQLWQDFYDRELKVPNDKRNYIEQNTRHQSEYSLWHQQRKLRVTASNFGRVAKRRSTTPVGNLVKSLLYSKTFSTEATRWGSTDEDEAKHRYLEYLRTVGHANASVKVRD